MNYRGFYINLATSTDRDLAMRKHLVALGLDRQYQRFDAVRGSEVANQYTTALPPGQLGCWLSHIALWRQALAAPEPIHIIEDDAALHPLLPAIANSLLDLKDWDLLFTDVYFHPPPAPEVFVALSRAWQRFHTHRHVTVMDLAAIAFSGTTSYFVHPAALPRLIGLMDGQWQTNVTIDVRLQELVRERKLRAFVAVPFFSKLSPLNVATTAGIQGQNLDILNAFRDALYVDADHARGFAEALSLNRHRSTEPLLGLYLELLRQVLGTVEFGDQSEKP